MSSATYRLVAVDYDGRGLEQAERLRVDLSARAGDEIPMAIGASSSGHPLYEFAIPRAMLRDTIAHAIGYHAGFIVHID